MRNSLRQFYEASEIVAVVLKRLLERGAECALEMLRINAEAAHAQQQVSVTGEQLDQSRRVVERALKIVGRCDVIYKRANETQRRKLNHGLFKAIQIKDRQVSGFEYEEPFAMLLTKGSSKERLVEVAGLSSNRLEALGRLLAM